MSTSREITSLTAAPSEMPGSGLGICKGFIQGLASRKDLGTRHTRSKSRALLIGPSHDLDRTKRLLSPGDNRLDGFQCGQNTESAIELPACRLRVDMRAGKHRGQRRIATLIAKEKIRYPVGEWNKANLARPRYELPTRLALD